MHENIKFKESLNKRYLQSLELIYDRKKIQVILEIEDKII